jgi:hypothetical protein
VALVSHIVTSITPPATPRAFGVSLVTRQAGRLAYETHVTNVNTTMLLPRSRS